MMIFYVLLELRIEKKGEEVVMDKIMVRVINDIGSSVFELVAFEELSVDDVGVVGNKTLAPEVGGVVLVSGLDSGKGSLDEVSSGSG